MNDTNGPSRTQIPTLQAAESGAPLRKSGLEIISDVPWGTHFCQFYATKADLIDTLVPYFAAGLAANEACMWVTSEPLEVEEAEAALRVAVPELDRFLASGQIEILDYSQWYTLGGAFDADRVLQGWCDKLEAARKRGFEGLRLTGNTFWLEKEDWEDFTNYETKIDSIIGSMRMLALCSYPLEKCRTREILDVIANHEFALVRESGRWELLKNIARHKAAQALAESDARFRVLFDNMAEGFALHEIITDETGEPCDYRFLDVNPAFERQTGLKRADLLGRRVLEVLPGIEPHWIKSCGHVALTGQPVHFESQLGPLQRSFRVFAYLAAPCRFAALLSDITEQRRHEAVSRRSQADLEMAIDAAQLGPWHWDILTGEVVWSPQCKAIYGLPADTAMTYERFLEAVHPEDRRHVDLALRDTVANRSEYRVEKRILRPDGSMRWTASLGRCYCDKDGHPVRLSGVTMDITERKRAEDALAQANEALEARVAERTRQLEQEMKLREQTQAALAQSQRMEALGQLTGGIAHDFNNLLMVIFANLELAESKIADSSAKRAVRRAIDAIEMGASLNRRLLSFARRRTLTPEHISLNDRVMEMTQLLRQTLGEQIELETRLDAGLWPTRADQGEIDSAIVNIAVNARDAMPAGGKLAIATANLALDAIKALAAEVRTGDYVCLTIADTGHGMPPEVLRRAIEPFFTTKATKEEGGGTGLGLSSVYGFARQSGGFVEISSEVGRGTTVRIYLPRAAEAARTAHSVKSAEDLPTGDAERILVVEDNNQVRQVTLARLESLGYAVLEAENASEAIEILKEESEIELVLSDVVMPGGLTGYDVVEWVRAQRPGLKVLLASGHNEVTGDHTRRPEHKLLAKPYTQAQLARAVREMLDA
jgi:PAS domain S-box-containing protein